MNRPFSRFHRFAIAALFALTMTVSAQQGAVVVLRGSLGADTCVVNIPWVDPAGTYNVVARFQNKDLGDFTGTELQAGEVSMALPPYGREILELSTDPKAAK